MKQERAALRAWRERRLHESAARKPRNQKRYTRKIKHLKNERATK